MTDTTHRLNSSLSDENFKLSCEIVHSKLTPPDESLINLINHHKSVENSEIILPDGRKFIWYLAIGSMINPISLYLRNLIPIISYPVVCTDYKVIFRDKSGMADIEYSLNSQFHGVLHLLTNEQMINLDNIEMFYRRIEVKCVDYQGQSYKAYAYQMTSADKSIGIPQERYLDIIVKGCEYYKVNPEYIDKLRNEQPVTPRKKPENFQTFTDVPSDVFISFGDLAKHDGTDPTLPIWICINGKVLEHVGLPPENAPDYQNQLQFHKLIKEKLAGRDVINLVTKALYEPLYKIPLYEGDICDEYRARIEDQYYNSLLTSEKTLLWKPVGWLRHCDNSS